MTFSVMLSSIFCHAPEPSGSSTMPTAHTPWRPRHPQKNVSYRASSKSLLRGSWCGVPLITCITFSRSW